MKKTILSALLIFTVIVLFFSSCSRGITMSEAANGKAKCGRYIK